MSERGTGVLEQYGLEVFRTCRTRGAVLCETSQGLKLLKEWTGSEKRIHLEYEVLSALEEETGLQTDCCMKNLEGNLISVGEDQGHYVLRQWFEGRECSTREVGEILTAAELLAKLHLGLRRLEEEHILERNRERQRSFAEEEKRKSDQEQEKQFQEEQGVQAAEAEQSAEAEQAASEAEEEIGEERSPASPQPLSHILSRHNRELKRARTYVRERKKKKDFELVVIRGFDKFYRQAQEAEAFTEKMKPEPERRWCHGEYSHHHVLLGGSTRAVTDFSRMRRDVQVSDLYYFMRKILEKHRWNLRLGQQILEAYTARMPLEREEWQYLYILFLYPEKYWKQINYYVNSNKAWIPARNVDKLKVLENQFEPRAQFLEALRRRI